MPHKALRPTLCETYYCTIDDPLPATVAVTYTKALEGPSKISTDGHGVSEAMVHAVIHPDAKQATVKAHLAKLRKYVRSSYTIDIITHFLEVRGNTVAHSEGELLIDEDWPHYFMTCDGFDVSNDFPKTAVILAISAPITKTRILDYIDDLLRVIKRDGLSRGVDIHSRGIRHSYEKNGRHRHTMLPAGLWRCP